MVFNGDASDTSNICKICVVCEGKICTSILWSLININALGHSRDKCQSNMRRSLLLRIFHRDNSSKFFGRMMKSDAGQTTNRDNSSEFFGRMMKNKGAPNQAPHTGHMSQHIPTRATKIMGDFPRGPTRPRQTTKIMGEDHG